MIKCHCCVLTFQPIGTQSLVTTGLNFSSAFSFILVSLIYRELMVRAPLGFNYYCIRQCHYNTA